MIRPATPQDATGIAARDAAGRAFHARMGYREVGRLPEVGFRFGRHMDLILMQKHLARISPAPSPELR